MLEVNCQYGHKIAIGAMNRSFTSGKLYGITGANGVGKSTLLLTMAGELEPIDGTVRINGLDPAVSGVGQVIRIGDPVFLPDLTISEHLALLANDNHDELTERWKLAEFAAVPPSWVSSGQRQRAFLATQLAQPATAVVIDEPERHLDSDWVDFVCAQLQQIARDGAIVIIATHSQQVLAACDEVIELC